jgi:hypothetical protein
VKGTRAAGLQAAVFSFLGDGSADDTSMSRTAPLFRIDPGWLFTLAGLAVMVSAALLPAERDLHDLRQQLAAIEFREARNSERLAAYDRFLKDLSDRDPVLLRRLAASQLNLMPEGQEPLLMATSIEHTVSDWIEATVPESAFEPALPPDTLLSRLADGERRLWLMGGGAMVVFLGLVMGFAVSPRPEMTPWTSPAGSWPPRGPAEPVVESGAELESAEAMPAEPFEWPEPTPAFEVPSGDSGPTVDAASLHLGDDLHDASTLEVEQDAWMRDHGSD